MLVIPPITINSTNLTSSTVAEPYAGETPWNAATSYAEGVEVIRTTTHRKYIRSAITPGVNATPPENAPTLWFDNGPTNKWAMFDQYRNVQTIETSGSMTIVLNPGKRINSLSLIGVQASTVTVTMTAPSIGTVFGPTDYNMSGRNTTTWSTYFFGDFLYKKSLLINDLPQYANATITVVFDNASLPVMCSGVIIGTSIYLGATQYSATSDALNFSKIERDDFGNSILLPRRSVPKTQQQLWSDKSLVNTIRQARIDLNAIPALWSGLDDNSDDPYFEAIQIFGIYKQFEINIAQPNFAVINLELEEL